MKTGRLIVVGVLGCALLPAGRASGISPVPQHAPIKRLSQQLKSNDADRRYRAAAELGGVRSYRDEVVAAIVLLADVGGQDSVANVRMASAGGLGILSSVGSSSPICDKDLTKTVPPDPTRQARRLALEALLKLAKDPEHRVAAMAVDRLGRFDVERSRAVILAAAGSPTRAVRASALHAMGLTRNPVFIKHLAGVIRHAKGDEPLRAIEALHRIDTVAGAGVLVAALKSPSAPIRAKAAWHLMRCQTRPVVGPLIEAMADRDGRVRSAAAGTLGTLGDDRAVAPLTKALSDKDPRVRAAGAEALANLRAAVAIDSLMRALSDKDARVRAEAARALGKLNATGARSLLAKCVDDPDSTVVRYATVALGRIGGPEAMETLAKAARHDTRDVRLAAARALGDIKDKRAIKILRTLLEDEEAYVRRTAGRVLLNRYGITTKHYSPPPARGHPR